MNAGTMKWKDPKIDVSGNSENGARSQKTELGDKKIKCRDQKIQVEVRDQNIEMRDQEI
jgi:hypothetical protein